MEQKVHDFICQITVALQPHMGGTPIGRLNIGPWATVFISSGVVLLISVPFVLLLGDGLLALAAWFVWRPTVQRALRRLRRTARKP
jgi:hypothetical protein